tara:strand:- start:212 stop:562 length:351 start_codon:yes stop_codon:yes gene_type:complete
MNFLIKSVLALVPDAQFISNDKKILQWLDSRPQPTQEQIDTKILELQALEPMRLLRLERNRRLAETDHFAFQDRIMTEEIKTYRQALRDLPATAEPTLDENGNLTNVDWPPTPEIS